MGQTLSAPITDKHSSSGHDKRFAYGASAMQGWRISITNRVNPSSIHFESPFLFMSLLSLFYCACTMFLFYLSESVPGDRACCSRSLCLFFCMFFQPYKPIIYIGHRAVLSLTPRPACSLSSFLPVPCLVLLK